MYDILENITIPCGWGRLLLAPSFSSARAVADALLQEQPHERDVAFYVENPDDIIAHAPDKFFVNPAYTMRLDLTQFKPIAFDVPDYLSIEPLNISQQLPEVNIVLKNCNMLPLHLDFWTPDEPTEFYLTKSLKTGQILSFVTVVRHDKVFSSQQQKSLSIWNLAVHPEAPYNRVGANMLNYLCTHFQNLGYTFFDLSVINNNQRAIALYKKMGFTELPLASIKCRNPLNQKLYGLIDK